MEIDRVFRAWQERLRGAMRQWQETQQDEGSLLRGAALAEAEEQLRKRPEELVAESGFIEQSLQERERIELTEVARRKREIGIARGITAGSLVAVVVSSGLGWMAWKQTQQAELNLADALSASALSLVEKGKDLDAFIPAIRAGKIQQKQQISNPSGLNALQEALNHRSEYNRLEGHGDRGLSLLQLGIRTVKSLSHQARSIPFLTPLPFVKILPACASLKKRAKLDRRIEFSKVILGKIVFCTTKGKYSSSCKITRLHCSF
jgi:hypothetical protein